MREQDWYERRLTGIGGSEAAAVLGVSPWKTPLQLWKEKRREIKPQDIETREQEYWGTILEVVIAREYHNRTNRRLIKRKSLAVHKKYPWMIANIDRYVIGMPHLITEIKNVGVYAFVRGEWGEDGSNKVPIYYYSQAQHNMEVTGADQCDMPILVGGNNYRCYFIGRDQVFIDRLIEEEAAFWKSVQSGENPPPPINLADLSILYPSAHIGINAEGSEAAARAWAEGVQVNAEIYRLKKLKEKHDFIIKREMEIAEMLSFNGVKLATWRNDKNGKRRFRLISSGIDFDEPEETDETAGDPPPA